MKDRFEKFIENQREQFDFRDPDPAIWNRVQKNIRTKRSFEWKVFLKRAAIFILIFSASFVVNEMIHRSRMQTKGLAARSGKENGMSGLKEAEAYYADIVKEKMNELKPVMANCPSLQEELNYDMSELDSVYVELKGDLKDNMANQEVIEAIIENYRLKISILEDILKELEPLGDECIPNNNEYAL